MMTNHRKMKEQPESCRPYERCMQLGPEVLTDAELLAVIIRCGTRTRTSVEVAADVLAAAKIHSGLQGLAHLSVPELEKIPGIGLVKAVQIRCVGELARRIGSVSPGRKVSINSPQQVADLYLQQLRFLEQEQMILLLLNTKNHLIKEIRLTKGTVNATAVGTREVLIEALRYQAVSMIVIHNHPSGDPEPSDEDLLFTEKLAQAAGVTGLRLLDHMIFGSESYISLKERGMI